MEESTSGIAMISPLSVAASSAASPSPVVHAISSSDAYFLNTSPMFRLIRSLLASRESWELLTIIKSGISPEAIATLFFCWESSGVFAAYQSQSMEMLVSSVILV